MDAQCTTDTFAVAADSAVRVPAGASGPADDLPVGRTARPSRTNGSSAQMPRPVMPATRRPVVMLVQQSRDDGLEMYAVYLRVSGYTALTVSSVTDALTLAPEADVVVTGIFLDGAADGIELVSRLRADGGTRQTPIIVLTACALPRERARAVHAGCDLFLTKPCLPDTLLRELRVLLPSTSATARGGRPEATMTHS